MPNTSILWETLEFSELSSEALHEILQRRQQVFVIEQRCIYDDIDGLDETSIHVIARDTDAPGRPIRAYARILAPGVKYTEQAFGRVLVDRKSRSTGLGNELVKRCISVCRSSYPSADIRISAQVHLSGFYARHGFITLGSPYEDAGIMHIDMLLPA